MASTNTIEKIIKAYSENDQQGFVEIIEQEIRKCKKMGHHNVARRLRFLISKMPKKEGFTTQGTPSPISNLTKQSDLYERIEPVVNTNEVILSDSSKSIVHSFLEEWRNFDNLAKYEIFPSNKLLFYGPPGTGKTRLAYAISHELGYPLILVRLDELISSFLGRTGKNIREIFEVAENENVVILLDEIDTIAKHRDDSKELGELKRVVTVLLQNIDCFPNNSVLIGATNHESLLDQAVWRRFSIRVEFELPSKKERERLFKLYLGSFLEMVNLGLLIEITDGLSGSEIHEICSKIKRMAIINDYQSESSYKHDEIIVRSLSSFSLHTRSGEQKKMIYDLCSKLKHQGIKTADLQKWTNIPYMTLKDNIES